MFGLGTFLSISLMANSMPFIVIATGTIVLVESVKAIEKSKK